VWVVTVPAKAAVRSAAVPDSAPLVTLSVMAPLVASLMVFNSAAVGASVSVTESDFAEFESAERDWAGTVPDGLSHPERERDD